MTGRDKLLVFLLRYLGCIPALFAMVPFSCRSLGAPPRTAG
jgi:hypothetical protein